MRFLVIGVLMPLLLASCTPTEAKTDSNDTTRPVHLPDTALSCEVGHYVNNYGAEAQPEFDLPWDAALNRYTGDFELRRYMAADRLAEKDPQLMELVCIPYDPEDDTTWFNEPAQWLNVTMTCGITSPGTGVRQVLSLGQSFGTVYIGTFLLPHDIAVHQLETPRPITIQVICDATHQDA